MFFVNGTSQGLAAESIPQDVYVICNLYGKCAQVSLVDVEPSEQSMMRSFVFLFSVFLKFFIELGQEQIQLNMLCTKK